MVIKKKNSSRKLSSQSVLITGGAGFIGSHLVDACLRQGSRVVVVDNFSTGSKKWVNSKVICYPTDLNDTASVQKILQKHQPQVIYHCVGHTQLRVALSSPQRDAQDNVGATLSLIQALLDLGITNDYRPQQLVFSSTSAVYGGYLKPPFTERTPVCPVNPYGIAKYAAEQYLQWYGNSQGVVITNLRYANVYGPRQSSNGEAGVVAKFLTALDKNRPIYIFGDGSHQRDYIFVDDVVAANTAVVEKKLAGVYNVGTRMPTRTTELAQLCVKLNNEHKNTPTKVIHKPLQLAEQKYSWLESRLLEKKTGWKAKISLNQGLIKTWKWYQKNDG